MAHNEFITLPNGKHFLTRVAYSPSESAGVTVLIVVSTFSLTAVVVLLTSIATSAWNTRKSINPHLFVRTHASAYLVSLLLCDLLQSIGSIMNAPWRMQGAVVFGQTCVAQGVIKHIADVGTAIWSLLIALHTFWILFLNRDTPRVMLISVLIGGWSLICTLVIAGPTTMNTAKNGSFFGISGYWCWISHQYPAPRITLDYMWLFISAFSSFVLYSLVFLKLRGNLHVHGWRMHFHSRKDPMYRGREVMDPQIIAIARQMFLYPIAYAVIILPISIVRFTEWSGHHVSFTGTIFADSIFLLSGVVNVLLFTLTRRVLPRHSVITTRLPWVPGNNGHDPENPPGDGTISRASSDRTVVDPEPPNDKAATEAPKDTEEEVEEIIKYLPTLDKVDDDYDDIYDYYRQDRNSNLFLTVQSPDDESFGQRPDLMIQVHTIPRSPRNPPVIPQIPRTPTLSLPDPDRDRFDPVSLASGRSRPSLPSPYPEESESEYEYSERESPLSESPKDLDHAVRSPVSAPGPAGGLTVPRELPRFATPQVATFGRNIFSRRP